MKIQEYSAIFLKLITRSIDFNEKAGRIVVAWDIFHWVHLKMVAPTTDCKWMVIGQKWVDLIERSRTLYSSMQETNLVHTIKETTVGASSALE